MKKIYLIFVVTLLLSSCVKYPPVNTVGVAYIIRKDPSIYEWSESQFKYGDAKPILKQFDSVTYTKYQRIELDRISYGTYIFKHNDSYYYIYESDLLLKSIYSATINISYENEKYIWSKLVTTLVINYSGKFDVKNAMNEIVLQTIDPPRCSDAILITKVYLKDKIEIHIMIKRDNSGGCIYYETAQSELDKLVGMIKNL